MYAFSDYNPIVSAVYFLATAGIAMFCMHPLLLILSMIGALALFVVRNGRRHMRSHLAYFGLFLAIALVNPIFSHNGVTVLFVVNDSPITAEALLYGLFAALAVIAVLYWFRTFSDIMTSDKLLYLFGKLSPRLALVLSIALRYVPLFGEQSKKVNRAQTALGLYKEDTVIDKARGGLRVFSVMVTWALENGIVTADSMSARGYGIGIRSHFSHFRFRKADIVLLIVTLSLSVLTCIGLFTQALQFAFYPAIDAATPTAWTYISCISYGILTMIPILIEAEVKIKWKYLRSKI